MATQTSTQRTTKMMQYVNWRMRVTVSDTRTLVGTLMAYDKHMNIVLADCEEYRKVKAKKGDEGKDEKRQLGLVLLRGENVISMSTETPPPPKSRAAQAVGRAAGPGVGKAAGRGMPTGPLAAAPKGLTGPVRGVGGPAANLMMPQASVSAGPVSYARGRGLPPAPPSLPRPPMPPAQALPPNNAASAPPPVTSGPVPPSMPPMGMIRPGGPMPPMMMGRGGPPPGAPMPPGGVPPGGMPWPMPPMPPGGMPPGMFGRGGPGAPMMPRPPFPQ